MCYAQNFACIHACYVILNILLSHYNQIQAALSAVQFPDANVSALRFFYSEQREQEGIVIPHIWAYISAFSCVSQLYITTSRSSELFVVVEREKENEMMFSVIKIILLEMNKLSCGLVTNKPWNCVDIVQLLRKYIRALNNITRKKNELVIANIHNFSKYQLLPLIMIMIFLYENVLLSIVFIRRSYILDIKTSRLQWTAVTCSPFVPPLSMPAIKSNRLSHTMIDKRSSRNFLFFFSLQEKS